MKTACKNELERRSEDLKVHLGELLFYLQSPLTENERKRCCRMFESKLREYLTLKYPRR